MSQSPETNFTPDPFPSTAIRFDSIARGFNLVVNNFGPMFLTGFITLVVPVVLMAVDYFMLQPSTDSTAAFITFAPKMAFLLFSTVINLVVTGAAMMCMTNFMLIAVRTGKASMKDYWAGLKLTGYGVVGVLVYTVVHGVGSLLCCIGQYVTGALSMFMFFEMVDKGVAPVEALKASYYRIKPNLWMAVAYYVLISLIAGAGYGICVVGLFFTFPVVLASIGFAYCDLTGTVVTPILVVPDEPGEPAPAE